MNRILKLTLVILVIILISMISYVGLFVQDTKFMKNLLPEYKLGMDLEGYRAVTISVSDEKETVYYDKDGNVVDEEDKNGKTEEVPVNDTEILTTENYEKTKEIIEKRLADFSISEYLIRLNEKDGTITVQLPENDETNIATQFIYSKGEFQIENEDGEVLLDNSNLNNVKVGYTTATAGTTIYLSFEFNDDSKEKLKDITNTYVTSTDEEGEETTKKVSIKIDGSTLLETSFDEEISNGTLVLTLGTTTDNSTLNSYMEQASNIAILINNGVIPIEYNVEQNRFIKSDLTLENVMIPSIIVGAIFLIAILVMIIKYRKLGLFAVISLIGYLAVLLIAVRYTNLIVTMEGICGILISTILNYILLTYILQILSKKENNIVEYKKAYNKSMISMILVLIPIMIIGIVLSFATWLPAYSFGTIIFWGVLIMGLYNAFVTRILFLNSIKNNI